MPTKEIKVTLEKEKECKWSYRYAELEGTDTGLRTVYITKEALRSAFGEFPKAIEVVITEKA